MVMEKVEVSLLCFLFQQKIIKKLFDVIANYFMNKADGESTFLKLLQVLIRHQVTAF